MNIQKVSYVMRQASKITINLRLKQIALAIVLLCFASTQNAEALSGRAQLGFGVSDFDIYSRGNLDLFLSDGRIVPYISVEGGDFTQDREYCSICNGVINSKYEYKAAVLGMHIAPFEDRRVVPYLTAGVLRGSVNYYATAKDTLDSIVSLSPSHAAYTAYRAGFGLHIALSYKMALEVELNGTSGVPAAHAVVANGTSTQYIEIFKGSSLWHIALGVRYDF
jgi:hypothetical protein